MYRSDVREFLEIWNLRFLMPAVHYLLPAAFCLLPWRGGCLGGQRQ
jgi:hypothetical protein